MKRPLPLAGERTVRNAEIIRPDAGTGAGAGQLGTRQGRLGHENRKFRAHVRTQARVHGHVRAREILHLFFRPYLFLSIFHILRLKPSCPLPCPSRVRAVSTPCPYLAFLPIIAITISLAGCNYPDRPIIISPISPTHPGRN